MSDKKLFYLKTKHDVLWNIDFIHAQWYKGGCLIYNFFTVSPSYKRKACSITTLSTIQNSPNQRSS